MKEGLIKDAYELILKEIQTILTLLYLLMIGVGMLFNYKKYAPFKINIFEYADVFDFLIAPFQDVRIVMVSMLVLLIPIALFWVGFYLKKKTPKIHSILNFGLGNKLWYQRLKIILFGLILFYSLTEGATGYGNFMKNNIDLNQTIAVKFANEEVLEGQLIGKTRDVLFLYTNNKVKIIPIGSAVNDIEIK